jgi:hypothetical protein
LHVERGSSRTIRSLPSAGSPDFAFKPVPLLAKDLSSRRIGRVESASNIPQCCHLPIELTISLGVATGDGKRRSAPPFDPPQHVTRIAATLRVADREGGELDTVPGGQRSQLEIPE